MKTKESLKTRKIDIRIALLLFGLLSMVSCSAKICSVYAIPDDRILHMREQHNISRSPGIPSPYNSEYKAQLVKKHSRRN